MSENRFSTSRKIWPAFTMLALSATLVYSNTFQASWHLDDYSSILFNSPIQIETLDFRSLANALSVKDGFSRPLAHLTFAINWYIGKDNVIGYHIFNVLIHILSSFFLFLTVRSLFQTPILSGKDEEKSHQIAVLSAFLWAIHPIQIQAVAYIVQRMACMSAMFYFSALFFYVKGRLSVFGGKKYGYFFLTSLAFALGLATKENTIMLPLSLILLEITFFRDLSDPKTRIRIFAAVGVSLLFIFFLGTVLFLEGDLTILYSYNGKRSFTPFERMLTQPRVLLFYLSQICYPLPHRFSIEHDFDFSTSLFTPWETFPSAVCVFMVIIASLFRIRKNPIPSFSFLFFFLNHIPESSILNLELVFEHRNYLPSGFLFLVISIGIIKGIEIFKQKKAMRLVIIASTTALFVALGMGTYLRNAAWRDEISLLADARKKAPKSARILHSLAWAHFEKIGRYDIAMRLYGEALNLDFSMKPNKALTFNNMAAISLRMGNINKAIELWGEAIKANPGYLIAKYRMARALADEKKYAKALDLVDSILLKTENHDTLLLKGQILLKQGKFDESVFYFKKCAKKNETDPNSLMYLGMALTLSDKSIQGLRLLKYAHSRYPKNVPVLLCLIESLIRSGLEEKAGIHIEKIFDIMSINAVESLAERLEDDCFFAPISREILWPAIAAGLEKKAASLRGAVHNVGKPEMTE